MELSRWKLKDKMKLDGFGNVADIITSLRILAAVGVLFAEVWSPAFWCIYVAGSLSDIFDGEIARRTHTESRRGAMLDSMADICFVAACLAVMLPTLDIPLWVWIWTACIAFVKIVNLVSGLVCHHKFMMLHTCANKLTGFLLFLLPMAVMFIPLVIPILVVCLVATFAALQEGHLIRTCEQCENL